ncbi:MAG: VanZ family protein [Acidobacteria bacterium]|nr:VanZ family protein [Acidobacteriota bacterium]
MNTRRGIFSSPAKAWTAVASYTLFLYGTLVLAFNLYTWLFETIGELLFNIMTWMYVPIGFFLLLFLIFFLPRRFSSYLTFALICLILAYCLEFLSVPAKRFHFFQYGPLTVLLYDALRFKCRNRSLYAWTFAAAAVIGLGDESVQGLLPQRHFGFLDLGVDCVAVLLTLLFIGFVMGEENYPWGRLHFAASASRRGPSRYRNGRFFSIFWTNSWRKKVE